MKKEICKACINRWAKQNVGVIDEDDGVTYEYNDLNWDKDNDWFWKRGKVFCPVKSKDISNKRKAPKFCLFKLEQLLA